MRCQKCSGLTVSGLTANGFQIESKESLVLMPYQHYPSIKAVETSAAEGCDLCKLLVDALEMYSTDTVINLKTKGKSTFSALSSLEEIDFDIRLRNSGYREGLLDVLYLTAGEKDKSYYATGYPRRARHKISGILLLTRTTGTVHNTPFTVHTRARAILY